LRCPVCHTFFPVLRGTRDIHVWRKPYVCATSTGATVDVCAPSRGATREACDSGCLHLRFVIFRNSGSLGFLSARRTVENINTEFVRVRAGSLFILPPNFAPFAFLAVMSALTICVYQRSKLELCCRNHAAASPCDLNLQSGYLFDYRDALFNGIKPCIYGFKSVIHAFKFRVHFISQAIYLPIRRICCLFTRHKLCLINVRSQRRHFHMMIILQPSILFSDHRRISSQYSFHVLGK